MSRAKQNGQTPSATTWTEAYTDCQDASARRVGGCRVPTAGLETEAIQASAAVRSTDDP